MKTTRARPLDLDQRSNLLLGFGMEVLLIGSIKRVLVCVPSDPFFYLSSSSSAKIPDFVLPNAIPEDFKVTKTLYYQILSFENSLLSISHD